MIKRIFVMILMCMIVLSTTVMPQTRRRTPQRSSSRAAKATDAKFAAEVNAGRDSIVAEIKTLSQFLYLLGGIIKSVEAADQAIRTRDAAPTATQQNEQSKARIKTSLRSVREGLDKLESNFRLNPALRIYSFSVNGITRLGETAESQAAANRFDEAGRTLLKVVNQLTDALAAMR